MWVIYDIECYINYFCVTFRNSKKDNNQKWTFEINDDLKINQQEELIDFLKNVKMLVGFNNRYYDDHIICFLQKNKKASNFSIYEESQRIISSDLWPPIKRSLDLYKLSYLDKLMKVLKQVAVNLRHDLIQDLPYRFDSKLTEEQKQEVLLYNDNDVIITKNVFHHLAEDIKIRLGAEKEYGIDCISESRSGLVNRIFEKLYENKLIENGIYNLDFKTTQTNRNLISMNDVIDDRFKTCFKTALCQKYVSDLSKNKVDASQKKLSIEIPPLLIGGISLQFGAGGVHSVDKPAYFEKSTTKKIFDADVTSYWPMVVVLLGIAPAHLNKKFFLSIYKNLIEVRIKAKKTGLKIIAEILKIVINALYGKFNSEHHWLRDPLCTLRTTVNGQLGLLYLIEKLSSANFKIISANTDGVTCIVDSLREEEYKSICKQWQDELGFELEFSEYSKYVRRDVNNYVAQTTDGKIKTKGDFNEKQYLDLAKGYSPPIIARAVVEYFINNTSIDTTLRNETNILDFCKSQKIDSKFQAYYIYADENKKMAEKKLSKTNRWYVSKGIESGTIVKRDGIKQFNLEAQGFVVLANDTRNFVLNNSNKIDYEYYKKEAKKIIDPIEMSRKQLTLY